MAIVLGKIEDGKVVSGNHTTKITTKPTSAVSRLNVPAQPTTPTTQPGFVQSVLQGVVSPFAKIGKSLEYGAAKAGEKAYEAITGKEAKVKAQKEFDVGYLGTYKPISSVKEGIGVGLEAAATVAGGGGAKRAVTSGIKSLLGQTAKQAAIRGGIPSAVGALGLGLQQDKTAGQIAAETAVSGVLGTVGYAALSGLSNVISKSVQKSITPAAKQADIVIKKAVDDGLKPSFSKNILPGQRKNALDNLSTTFKVIFNNAEEVTDASGISRKVLPTDIVEMRNEAERILPSLFNAYDDIATKGGKKISINTTPTYKKLMTIASDPNRSKDVRQFAKEAAKDVLQSNGASPKQLQQKLADFNLYFNDTGTSKAKAQVYGTAAEDLLDLVENSLDSISKTSKGGQYRDLRKVYGSVRNSLKYLNQSAKRTTNSPKVPNLFTGDDIIIGSLNPKAIALNVARKTGGYLYKKATSPDKMVNDAFRTLERASTGNKGIISPIVSKTASAISRLPSPIINTASTAAKMTATQTPKQLFSNSQ